MMGVFWLHLRTEETVMKKIVNPARGVWDLLGGDGGGGGWW
jgi:hypothetical protein